MNFRLNNYVISYVIRLPQRLHVRDVRILNFVRTSEMYEHLVLDVMRAQGRVCKLRMTHTSGKILPSLEGEILSPRPNWTQAASTSPPVDALA